MMTNTELIRAAEQFLFETFSQSPCLQANPADRDYRLEHSYRVANIAKTIAAQEGFSETDAVISGLLHDIAYCEPMNTREDRLNHGRRSAAIARPFLLELGMPENRVNEICYGIAIHVDDQADFVWTRSAFSETVSDADNLDRFDVYRIYETLEWKQFSSLPLSEKKKSVAATLENLQELKTMKLGTVTAASLWQERLAFYVCFYEKLRSQLNCSSTIV